MLGERRHLMVNADMLEARFRSLLQCIKTSLEASAHESDGCYGQVWRGRKGQRSGEPTHLSPCVVGCHTCAHRNKMCRRRSWRVCCSPSDQLSLPNLPATMVMAAMWHSAKCPRVSNHCRARFPLPLTRLPEAPYELKMNLGIYWEHDFYVVC